jgi:hypothetical protein
MYQVSSCETSVPKTIDQRGLSRAKLSKSARAILAADWQDGSIILAHPTAALAAVVMGVSMTYVTAAKKLTPAQRAEVRIGQRPLIIAPMPKPMPPLPSAEEQLRKIVAEIGVAAALNLLATMEAGELLAAA